MNSLSVAQMREADNRAIKGLGIPSEVLMDRAGRSVFQHIDSNDVVIVCGKGNNGGDGFVIARYCFLAGYSTTVFVLVTDDQLSKDARTFKKVYTRLGGKTRVITSESEWLLAIHEIPSSAVMVDALLGTGIQGELTGLTRSIIEHWPTRTTIAVDIPSGLNADTGEVAGVAIKATTTISFQWSKIGLEQPQAKEYIGNLIVTDIGIPKCCADDDAWNQLQLDT